MLKSYATIVISKDKTYPGLVTKVETALVLVVWYKWGYEHQPFTSWLIPADAEKHAITEAECIQRFRALPPKYTPSA